MTLHVVVGPDEHGVVRHALAVAAACGDPVLRATQVQDVEIGAAAGHDVVHLAFADRLFGPTCERAAERFVDLAGRFTRAGAGTSVTLHDVPRGETELDRRRRAAFGRVAGAVRGVVVCSRTDLAALAAVADHPPVVTCVPLPLDPVVPLPRPDDRLADAVVTLGFVHPDRGYEVVLAALPPGSRLVALGRVAEGHEDYADGLRRRASATSVRFEITGFVPDDRLGPLLRGAGVPVAPNARVGSSASVLTWLAHGRRPLMADSEHARELVGRYGDAIRLYDPADVAGLARCLESAVTDRALTDLPAAATPGPTGADCAARYRAHLAACVIPAARETPDGFVVPGNRVDLLPGARADRSVSVVIPHYDDPRRLDLVLAALTRQTVAGRLEVIVADDGSPEPPDLTAAGGLPTRLVTQPHHGFGAARARNLGATVATGDLLAFLDGDTVPEPDYLERLLARPSVCPDAVAVGRRRHADLSAETPESLLRWPHGRPDGALWLAEPSWLRDGYTASRDLLDADRRSYRFVISAVLGLARETFERVGGFEESFDGYGGEDWELAHRLWNDGALFVHEPVAVAWHDGPHWAERDDVDHDAVKNRETLTLSRLLPDPDSRTPGQWLPYAFCVVLLDLADPVDTLSTARSALASGADCAVFARQETGRPPGDARVPLGPPDADVLARAAVVAHVRHPCDLADLPGLARRASAVGLVETPAVTLRATRAMNRCARRAGVDARTPHGLDGVLTGRFDPDLARDFGRVELAGPPAGPTGQLAAALARIRSAADGSSSRS